MPLAIIQLPPINWTGDVGAKRVLLLEDCLPGFVLPPSPWIIKSFGLWDQPLADYPGGGASGRIGGGIDPRWRYVKQSNFPYSETCDGQTLKRLGRLEFLLGREKSNDTHHPDGFIYRPGTDAFIMVAECSGFGSRGFSVFPTVGVECDDFEMEPETVFSSALDLEVPASPFYHFRTLIPNTKPGTQVRVRRSSRAYGCAPLHIGVGIQSGGPDSPNMTATPLNLLYGGASVSALSTWNRDWCDWMPLVQGGVPLIVSASTTGNFSYRDTGPSCAWYSTADSWNAATMASPTLVARGQRVIDAVQVK